MQFRGTSCCCTKSLDFIAVDERVMRARQCFGLGIPCSRVVIVLDKHGGLINRNLYEKIPSLSPPLSFSLLTLFRFSSFETKAGNFFEAQTHVNRE